MIIQTWHALSKPPQDFPLAFCDGSSIADEDLVEAYSTLQDYQLDAVHDTNGTMHKMWTLHHNPDQRWYYFPEMTSEEFVLFKGYDSRDDCNPRSAHSAFDNRRAYPAANPRTSVEARFFVYFD
jgi:hypothetical protein